MATYDPVRIEIWRQVLASVAEEMGERLKRSAFSPNVKERRDYSCAIFDAKGAMIAQAAHIPVHLGSMSTAVRAAIATRPMEPGDMVLLNDPFAGGTHLPDLTVVAPAYLKEDEHGAPSFYVAARAHHADIGSAVPGSFAVADEVFGEGLRIPPVRLVRGKGAERSTEVDRDIVEIIRANARAPEERSGDLLAQTAACLHGVRRLWAIAAERGREEITAYAAHLLDYAARRVRAFLATLPPGRHEFEDVLDSDGLGAERIPIRVALDATPETLRVDFTGTAAAVRGPVNAPRSVTLSAVLYVIRLLAGEDLPANDGVLAPVEVVTPRASLVDARYPSAVAAGNVETSQRIVDALLGAFARAIPERVPAASAGTMTNVALGGRAADGATWAYYETVAGGAGASARGPGASAIHTHMTNTWNTPIEALEHAYPIEVCRYEVHRGSGGAGVHRGGDGIRREIRALAPCRATVVCDRHAVGPWGLAGGAAGAAARVYLRRPDGTEAPLPPKGSFTLAPGDVLGVLTPGGGGWGAEPAAAPGA